MAMEKRTIIGSNVLTVSVVLLAAFVYSTVWSADAPLTRQRPATPTGKTTQGTPAMTTTSPRVAPAEKKPIVINPAVLDAVYHALLMTDAATEETEFVDALNKARDASVIVWTLKAYQHEAKSCVEKKYTTEDQKKAGCIGSDTLDQCSKKLFNACFSKTANHSFLNKRKKLLDAADRLEKAQKAYMGKLKMIPEPPK